jgi:hypothetical protein
MEEYLGRVQALVWEFSAFLTPAETDEVQHLVDHGEPAEGMRTLAWIIVEADKHVPAMMIKQIRELSADLVAPEQMPPDLDAHALIGET